MSPKRKFEHKTGVIVASLLAALSLSAIAIAAIFGPPHPEPHQPDPKHPHFVSNSRPMKHFPHPSPWMIRATGWAVSVASQLS
jgi:hypothetical protein